MNSIFKK